MPAQHTGRVQHNYAVRVIRLRKQKSRSVWSPAFPPVIGPAILAKSCCDARLSLNFLSVVARVTLPVFHNGNGMSTLFYAAFFLILILLIYETFIN